MSETTGASLIGVTLKVAPFELASRLGSVAVKVISSAPFQSSDGIVIVAIRLISIETLRSVLPE